MPSPGQEPSRPGRPRPRAVALGIAIAAVLLVAVAGLAVSIAKRDGGGGGERPAAAKGAPNVIVISLDDTTAAQINRKTMPKTLEALHDEGTSFTRYIATSPLCCPSRANFLTGQYAHNNRVMNNNYVRLKEKANILPTWLQQAGYRTVHVGKYLNNFTSALDDPLDVPEGWDDWYTILGNNYYDYRASDNGEQVDFGSEPDDYLTRVIDRKVLDSIAENADDERPFYMQIDQYASHAGGKALARCRGGATPDVRDYDAIDEMPPEPPGRNVNEADVSDKPSFIRSLDRLSPAEMRLTRVHYQCAEASLLGVDRGIDKMLAELRRTKQLDDTAIFLISDQGYFFGEHRIPAKKEFPYDENLRPTLLVRLPADRQAKPPIERVDELAGNIDLAPTILDLAGGEPCRKPDKCRVLDGRSLLPLMTRRNPDWPQARNLLLELKQKPKSRQSRVRPCSFIGVRSRNELFVRYRKVALPGGHCERSDELEHYDLRRDPQELDNLAAGNRIDAAGKRLRRTMRELRDCAGTKQNPKEDRTPCE